jgi:hypothetical protein
MMKERGTGRLQVVFGNHGTAEENTMAGTVWQCEQWRAGQVVSKVLFNSKSEAEEFCSQMHRVEPDIFWRVQPVEARLVWN